MRIVHVICSDRFAGVEQFVLRLAVEQARAGHSVHVAGGSGARMTGPLTEATATWEPVTGMFGAWRAVRRHAPDADVIASHMTDADVAASWALGGGGPALVSTRHFAAPRGGVGPIRADAIVRRRVNAEISISTAVANAVGVPSVVVHSGVPISDVPVDRPPSQKRVLMVQRLQPEKRTDVGVRAFAASGLAVEGWRLDIAGEGRLLPELRALVDELGLSGSVTLLGFRTDLPALHAQSSLFLAPCDVEGLGLAVLEAMSAGLAPVAADSAGHRDVIEGLDARAGFRSNDVEDAAAALRAFADDPDRRHALEEAARARALTEFSLARQAQRTDEVYRDAIAGRRR